MTRRPKILAFVTSATKVKAGKPENNSLLKKEISAPDYILKYER